MVGSGYSEKEEMRLRFSGYRGDTLTFLCDECVKPGMMVRMSDDFEASCIAYDAHKSEFFGICVATDQELTKTGITRYCAVQTSGYVELECEGQIHLGYQPIAVDCNNIAYCDYQNAKKLRLVVYSTANVVGFIL